MISQLNIARAMLVFGFCYGLTSLLATFTHIGDPAYLVQSDFGGGQAHSWYHALREACGDIATIVIVLYLFFCQRESPPASDLVDQSGVVAGLLPSLLDWHALYG